jgi:hypothetical protein
VGEDGPALCGVSLRRRIMINDNIKNMNICEFVRMDVGTDTIVESGYLTIAITAKVDAGPRLPGLHRGAHVHMWKRRARLRSEQIARRTEVDWCSIKAKPETKKK